MTLKDLVTADIPKGHIGILAQIFYRMDTLSRQDSRKRTRFVKWLNKKQQEYQEEQMELIEEFGERDDNGELVTEIDDNGSKNYTIPKAVQEEYREALKELQKEHVTFGELSTQDLVKGISLIAYNYQEPLGGGEAEVFDTFIDNFDEMFDEYDKAFEEDSKE